MLTKIAIHEALAVRKKQSRFVAMDAEDDGVSGRWISKNPDPEKELMDKELATLLEDSVEALPESYRLVFVLREVEKMDTRQTAECLGLSEENIKVRLHRARALMRRELTARAGPALSQAFPFHLSRCDRIVAEVMGRIRNEPGAGRTE